MATQLDIVELVKKLRYKGGENVKINWLKDVDIFEISYVNRPAIDKRFIALKMMEYKSVIPFRKTTALPEGTPWDAGVEVKKAEVKDLKIMCTWYDEKDADNKGAYKLPHHKSGGGYPVVWNGVKAAMGALMGARGGVILPDSDRKGVYNHLAKHYKQFDKEVPEFKELDELDKSFVDKMADKIKNKLGIVDTKIGRVLSKANETKLVNAADSIVKAGETIKSVLASVGKNLKKEGSDMDEKEVKDIVKKTIAEEMGTFKKDIEDKLEELLKKDVEKEVEGKEKETEQEITEEDEEKKSKKDVSKKKDSEKSDDDKDNDLLTKISDIVEKKVGEVKSEVDKINEELNIKPESDKKKDNKKDSDKKAEDSKADFTGILGIGNI